MLLGRVVIGGLIDRFFAPRVMAAVLCCTMAGFQFLQHGSSPAPYLLAALGIGMALGAEMDFLGYLVSRYYVRQAFATVFGLLFAVYSLGASFGPLLIGWLEMSPGGYGRALSVLTLLTLLLIFSLAALPRYGVDDEGVLGEKTFPATARGQ